MISNDVRPIRRPARAPVGGDVARGLGAFVALAGLLVGVPFVLLRFGHWPITGVPSWSQVADLPTTLISDSTVLGIFTVALWVGVGGVHRARWWPRRWRRCGAGAGGPCRRRRPSSAWPATWWRP